MFTMGFSSGIETYCLLLNELNATKRRNRQNQFQTSFFGRRAYTLRFKWRHSSPLWYINFKLVVKYWLFYVFIVIEFKLVVLLVGNTVVLYFRMFVVLGVAVRVQHFRTRNFIYVLYLSKSAWIYIESAHYKCVCVEHIKIDDNDGDTQTL